MSPNRLLERDKKKARIREAGNSQWKKNYSRETQEIEAKHSRVGQKELYTLFCFILYFILHNVHILHFYTSLPVLTLTQTQNTNLTKEIPTG